MARQVTHTVTCDCCQKSVNAKTARMDGWMILTLKHDGCVDASRADVCAKCLESIKGSWMWRKPSPDPDPDPPEGRDDCA